MTHQPETAAQLAALVRDFLDPDPCQLDHHGYCQAHSWLCSGRCPHARAREVLAEYDCASSAGVAPATDPPSPSRRAGLRDEIVNALGQIKTIPPVAHRREQADHVLAVLYREWPWLRAEAEDAAQSLDRASLSAKLWEIAEQHIVAEWICCEPLEPRHTLCAKGYAALGMVKSLLVDADPATAWNPNAPLLDAVLSVLPASVDRAGEEHRLALSMALGLGTGAPWDAIHDRVTELGLPPLGQDPVARRLGLVDEHRATVLREAAAVASAQGGCPCNTAETITHLLRHMAATPTAELRRVAAETRSTTETNGACGRTKSVAGVEYPPCARPAGHPEAYCRSTDGKQHFLAVLGPRPAAAPPAGGVRQPSEADDRLHCPRCAEDITDYAEEDHVFRTGDDRPYCSGECVIAARRAGLPTAAQPNQEA